MGTSRINDYTLDVYYRYQNARELKGVTDLLGKMPEAENEIIVEHSYLAVSYTHLRQKERLFYSPAGKRWNGFTV